MENNYEHIPQEQFAFAQLDDVIHDKKLETKARGYFADAFLRFKKNKSSLVAAWIIGFLVLFAIVSPILSPYDVQHKDTTYTNFAPYVPAIAELELGFLDGGVVLEQAQDQLHKWKAIGIETGMDPVIKYLGTKTVTSKYRGQLVTEEYQRLKINKYFGTGIIHISSMPYEEFANIQKFQDETGIQVFYPYVDYNKLIDPALLEADTSGNLAETIKRFPIDNPNVWYQVKDAKGTPALDANGNYIPAYATNASQAGAEYTSSRVAGDDGSYVYSQAKSGSVAVRVCYYNYYIYKNGHAPSYLFGTNVLGQDLFCAIGVGARFSLIFAILVSAINLTIGAVYGAIEGYYGGAVDMVMERISDVLSGIPTIVVVTLFQLHLAPKYGAVPSFLYAFIMTGWIGMASLTRKQFYRFKGQEFVLAARTLGASDRRLMFKHVFPNSLGTIITSCALVIPGVISSETTLTYLGIINLSEMVGTSIGVLMSQGQTAMTSSPHAMFFPALFVSLLLISFNLFGNGLRDAFNPSTRGSED